MPVLTQPVTIFPAGNGANLAAPPPATGIVIETQFYTEVQMPCVISPNSGGLYDITGSVLGVPQTYLNMYYQGFGPNGRVFMDNPQ